MDSGAPLNPDPSPEPGTGTTTGSNRRTAAIGVPIIVGAGAVGGVLFILPDDEADSVRSEQLVTTTAAPIIAPPTTQTVFEPTATVASSTQPPATLAPTSGATPDTTAAPATTAPPATTVPPSTLVETPDEPIAPPSDPRGYEEQIQLGGLQIPSLGVDEPLLSGIRLTTLDRGPGHWPGTAMPGEAGNVVVAAHRTSHGGPFRNIDQLQVGDPVVFTTDAGVVEYNVTEVFVVEPDALWIVDQTDDSTATLFACHPPGSVAQRIVVKLALNA